MPMLEWLEPMAATLTQDRFGGPPWLFECPFDGIRLLAYQQGDEVRVVAKANG
jgi:ATP-dependent DNA ligase